MGDGRSGRLRKVAGGAAGGARGDNGFAAIGSETW